MQNKTINVWYDFVCKRFFKKESMISKSKTFLHTKLILVKFFLHRIKIHHLMKKICQFANQKYLKSEKKHFYKNSIIHALFSKKVVEIECFNISLIMIYHKIIHSLFFVYVIDVWLPNKCTYLLKWVLDTLNLKKLHL